MQAWQRAPALLLALWALLLVSSPMPANWLPAQRMVVQWQLPDFDVRALDLSSPNPHLQLQLQVTSRGHLVMNEQVVPPGAWFAAATPAHSGLPWATLLAGAGAAGLWSARRRRWCLAAAVLLHSGLLLVLLPTLVLAGNVWGLGVGAFGEFSLAALQVALAEALLRGGGGFVLVLSIAALWQNL